MTQDNERNDTSGRPHDPKQKKGTPSADLENEFQTNHVLRTFQAELKKQNKELYYSQQALEASEERFRTLFETVPAAIQGYDSNGIIRYWNIGSENIYGYSKDEAIGKNITDLIIPPEMREQVREVIKQGARTGKMPPAEELLLMRKDGSRIAVFSNHTVLKPGTNEAELYCLDIDMTVQYTLQSQLRQAQKMESVGTMAGGIAHDFNNLLHMILGNTELALEDIDASNPAHPYLEEIKLASLRSADVVKQLLNFSRESDIVLKPIDVVSIIKNTLKLLRSTIPSTIEIKTLLPDTQISILGDPVQIDRILINICTNASQAMGKTGGTLDVTAKAMTLDDSSAPHISGLRKGDYLEIEIQDTGPGIAAADMNRIFDPYFTTKEIGKGSGMGLAIVHGIVKSHNGAVSVRNRPKTGAVFTLLFPVIDAAPEHNAKTGNTLLQGNASILLVDDEEAVLRVTGETLERLGYQVETSDCPQKAMEIFQSKPAYFDLVITDMAMPKMSGEVLAKKMKQQRPDIPVIICTGHGDLMDEQKADQLGIDGFIIKPMSKPAIADAIQKILAPASPD